MLEIAKLLVQLLGAVFVAWLTVRWALSRYKSEKLWERRLISLADLITAIGNLHLRASSLRSEALMHQGLSFVLRDDPLAGHTTATQKVLGEISVAVLLLPAEMQGVLSCLKDALERQMQSDTKWSDHLSDQICALDRASKSLVEMGRTHLRVVKHGG